MRYHHCFDNLVLLLFSLSPYLPHFTVFYNLSRSLSFYCFMHLFFFFFFFRRVDSSSIYPHVYYAVLLCLCLKIGCIINLCFSLCTSYISIMNVSKLLKTTQAHTDTLTHTYIIIISINANERKHTLSHSSYFSIKMLLFYVCISLLYTDEFYNTQRREKNAHLLVVVVVVSCMLFSR